MFGTKNPTDTAAITDKIADSAEHALDSLAGNVQDMRNFAQPIVTRAQEQARDLLQNGRDIVRTTSHQVTDAARHARDGTVSYVKEEPVKAMLIAAATGAALMALVNMMSHSRRS